MGILGGIIGGIGKAAEGIGNAVNKNYRSMRGDKAETETYVHQEQMAAVTQYTAEFLNRPPKTKWDSFVDGLNRLPRPLFTFGIMWLFIWCWVDPAGVIDFLAAIQLIPDDLWTMLLMIAAFFFGGRFVKEDLSRPKLTEEQRNNAIALIKERERAAQIADEKAKQDSIVALPPPEPTVPYDKLPDIPEEKSSSAAVDIMIKSILKREGGYVDNKADRGGATNLGITIATLADWRGVPVTKDDVRALGEEEAFKIYRAKFYLAPGIDTLPVGIQAHVLDCAVNSGPRAAVKLLQRVLNSYGESLVIDGIIGNATRDACRKYDTDKLNNALVDARLRFYDSLVENDPSQRIFLAGWTKRAKSFSV